MSTMNVRHVSARQGAEKRACAPPMDLIAAQNTNARDDWVFSCYASRPLCLHLGSAPLLNLLMAAKAGVWSLPGKQ